MVRRAGCSGAGSGIVGEFHGTDDGFAAQGEEVGFVDIKRRDLISVVAEEDQIVA